MHDYSDPEFQQAFVNAQWDSLAALAWQKHAALGRGALYIHSFYTFPGTPKVAAQIEYIREADILNPDLLQLVQTYDPTREMVALIGDALGMGLSYKFRNSIAQLPPPVAFEKQQRG